MGSLYDCTGRALHHFLSTIEMSKRALLLVFLKIQNTSSSLVSTVLPIQGSVASHTLQSLIPAQASAPHKTALKVLSQLTGQNSHKSL